MEATEPSAVPEEDEQVRPDVPEPKEWLAKIVELLDGLERLQRARELLAGSTKEESGPDYPVAQDLLAGLEAAMKGRLATLLVSQTRDNSPGWVVPDQ